MPRSANIVTQTSRVGCLLKEDAGSELRKAREEAGNDAGGLSFAAPDRPDVRQPAGARLKSPTMAIFFFASAMPWASAASVHHCTRRGHAEKTRTKEGLIARCCSHSVLDSPRFNNLTVDKDICNVSVRSHSLRPNTDVTGKLIATPWNRPAIFSSAFGRIDCPSAFRADEAETDYGNPFAAVLACLRTHF